MNQNHLFHFFEEKRNDSLNYVSSENPARIKKYQLAEFIPLPSPEKISTSLSFVIEHRVSKFSSKNSQVNLKELSTLLYWSAAEIASRTIVDGDREYKKIQRPHPSGGACYPLEVYCCLNQKDFKRGLYHYRPDLHGIELVKELDPETMNLFTKILIKSDQNAIPVMLLLSYIQEHNIFKYGPLGIKLALIEAGHIAQNIYLTATALELSCCAIGSVEVDAAHRLLEIDGSNEHLIYALALGQ